MRDLPASLEKVWFQNCAISKLIGVKKMPNLKELGFIYHLEGRIENLDEFKRFNEQCRIY